MREILFRGKRKDNGEWVEGLLWKKKYNDGNRIFISCFPDKDDNEEVFVIDKNTVGQYTGLTDKNGKKIFEGDIIKILPFHSAGLHNEAVAIVCFDRGAFSCKILDHNPASLYMYEKWRVVVLGNIHDNPELLGE